jgi:hypothetical protein
MKTHNVSSITVEPDADGVSFTLCVKIKGGGEMVLNGPEAIAAFYTISGVCTDVYEDDKGYMH